MAFPPSGNHVFFCYMHWLEMALTVGGSTDKDGSVGRINGRTQANGNGFTKCRQGI
jgi:hypothetical protein